MTPEESYDIIVIGAGPAGSTAAMYAARSGASVLLIDKKKDIGTPIQCGGFLPCYEELEELLPGADLPDTLKAIPESCIHTSTRIHRFIAPNLDPKEFEVPANVLDRCRFDKHLAREAARAGAELMVGTRADSIEGDIVSVRGIQGEFTIKAKVIIGADGPTSLAAKTAGLIDLSDNMGRAVALEYELTGVDIDTEAVEMFFGRDYAPGGYAWIISQGGDTANIGVGIRQPLCEKGVSAQDYLHRFMYEHPRAAPMFEDARITAVISGIVPVGGAPPETVKGNIIICGDAAGHLIATNGGGIPTAMVGGRVAGETAAGAVSGTCQLSEYENGWREQMGLEIRTSVYVKKLMDGLMRSDPMMSTAMKMITPEQMKALQRGRLPDPVKKMLKSLNAGFG
ncbi:MAG: geranylgeranyl reductase family protein [Methanosarcinales archaeon]|nr:geranylgeranyl reductase family protein [Methanosarcinales archaeon]